MIRRVVGDDELRVNAHLPLPLEQLDRSAFIPRFIDLSKTRQIQRIDFHVLVRHSVLAHRWCVLADPFGYDPLVDTVAITPNLRKSERFVVEAHLGLHLLIFIKECFTETIWRCLQRRLVVFVKTVAESTLMLAQPSSPLRAQEMHDSPSRRRRVVVAL